MSRRPTSPPHIAEQQRNRAKQDTKFPLRKGWFVVATDKYVTEPMTEEDARREFDRQINVMGYPFVQLQIVDEFYSPLATVEEYDNRSSTTRSTPSDAETIARARQYHKAIRNTTDRDRRYLLERKLRGLPLNLRSPNPRRANGESERFEFDFNDLARLNPDIQAVKKTLKSAQKADIVYFTGSQLQSHFEDELGLPVQVYENSGASGSFVVIVFDAPVMSKAKKESLLLTESQYALDHDLSGASDRSPNPRRGLLAKGAFGPNAGALAAARRPSVNFGAPCQVIVGNIGTVYDGPYGVDADRAFHEYREQSRSGYGRAGGESVTLMCNGEILREHYGESAD